MSLPPLRVFIVDDEPPARNRLKDLIADCQAELNCHVVGEACNGIDALEQLSHTASDIVLLDIRMPEMDGIELAQHLQKLSPAPIVIFTTAYDNYAIQAFELHAIDYLLKPIRLSRLIEALNRAKNALPTKSEALQALKSGPRQNLSIHERGKIILIPVDKIVYLRAELKYVTVRTVEREHLLEESLTTLESELGDAFVRIHRNCLAAKSAIVGLEKHSENGESTWVAKMRGIDELLPISRRQQHVVKELLGV